MKNNYGFDTTMIHGGAVKDDRTGAISPSIYPTTAYDLGDVAHAQALFELKEPGNIYSRLSNPTNDALEARVAALDGGIGALAFSSGHAAIFNTIVNLCESGDELVSSINIYGGAINMLGVTLARLGINVRFVSADDLDQWEDAITDKTRLFFTELIGNPNANVSDLEGIASIAHKNGIPFMVDSTFTTPYLCRPIDFGADLVLHSATKFLGGHGTAMGGIVVDSGRFDYKDNPRFPRFNEPDVSYHGVVFADLGEAAFISRLRALTMRDLGSCPSPFNSFLILQGIETLSLRMKKHSANASKVAQFLSEHESVSYVNYPTLEGNPYHALAKKYLPNGAGSVFTFGLKGGRDAGARFIDSLELIGHVANVGDVRSLVIHPATTTHSQLSAEQLAMSGISEDTVRLSIGLEDGDDIIADLEQAIEKSQSTK